MNDVFMHRALYVLDAPECPSSIKLANPLVQLAYQAQHSSLVKGHPFMTSTRRGSGGKPMWSGRQVHVDVHAENYVHKGRGSGSCGQGEWGKNPIFVWTS